MIDLFLPSYVKRGKRVLEGVKKFIAYNKDLMTPEALSKLVEARDNYKAVLETRNAESLKMEEESLKLVCDKALPSYKTDALKENIEVIVVAVIVALGVRAYLVQPFKIPTASMQPTLNGLIGEPQGKDAEKPNLVKQAFDFVWRGSNYTELRAPQSSGDLRITSISQRSTLMFFTRTTVGFSDGSSQTCYAPATQLVRDLWLDNEEPSQRDLRFRGLAQLHNNGPVRVEDFGPVKVSVPVTPGAVLARGYVHTGSQLLVDKFSYHFRQPRRGEVFVFNTMGIATSNAGVPSPNNNIPSQHYIKRLVGTPNDKLAVVPPNLYINGAVATEPGIAKVIAHEGNPDRNPNINMLHGYTKLNDTPTQDQVAQTTVTLEGVTTTQYELGPTQYFAMGDNSANSSDSRAWGAVPQQNLVGPAWVVYWPFAPHWGRIR